MLVTGTWRELNSVNVAPLILSGFIGIFLGDTVLFATLNRIGPRRAGILFAMNAPIAAVLGWLVLDETLKARPPMAVALPLTNSWQPNHMLSSVAL